MKENEKICCKCKHWIKIEDSELTKDSGKCVKLSGKFIKEGLVSAGEKYPEEEITGVVVYPPHDHDIGFTYNTKKWFGCVHFSKF